jgi:hypothetical protein
MSSAAIIEPAGRVRESSGAAVGAAIAYLGFLAIVVSAVWTVQPLPQVTAGKYEHYFTLILALALIAASLVGRARLAATAAGKLLCALGAVVCLSHALDPTFESIPAVAARMPMWIADAYPGLATVGWVLAALGALIWWAGGATEQPAALYRGVAVVCTLLLILATWGVRRGLVAAGYEVPLYGSALIVWRLVEVSATLVVALSVCGQRRFAQWPMLLFGLGLLGHSVRSLLTPPA